MSFADNGLLLDYWKEYYGEEIRKRELIILKMRLALEFYSCIPKKEGVFISWFSGGCEGENQEGGAGNIRPMGTKAREVLNEIGGMYGHQEKETT